MHIGIMGLPGAGKTTVFNVLARARAQVAGYSAEPNRAVVKVPDSRLDRLAELFQPEKVTPAEIQYVDVAGLVQGSGKEGSAVLLSHLRNADVLLHVVRAFPGPLGDPDPLQDIAALDTELILADLMVVEKRVERLEKDTRLGRYGQSTRQMAEHELALLSRIKMALEAEKPIRQLALHAEDERLLRGYGFLTSKPVLVLLNTHDASDGSSAEVADRLQGPGVDLVALDGKLEMELGDLDPSEAREFMEELGIAEPGLSRVIQRSYRLARLHSFFTVGTDEVRAWTIPMGATAVEAAGAIDSDLARGFIRAEVVDWQTLLEMGSLSEARKRGLLRSEGKSYVVSDGDVLTILFNV